MSLEIAQDLCGRDSRGLVDGYISPLLGIEQLIPGLNLVTKDTLHDLPLRHSPEVFGGHMS